MPALLIDPPALPVDAPAPDITLCFGRRDVDDGKDRDDDAAKELRGHPLESFLEYDEFIKLLDVYQSAIVDDVAYDGSHMTAALTAGLTGSFWSWPQDAEDLDFGVSAQTPWCHVLVDRKIKAETFRIRGHIDLVKSSLEKATADAVLELDQIQSSHFSQENVSLCIEQAAAISAMEEKLHKYIIKNFTACFKILNKFDKALYPSGNQPHDCVQTTMPFVTQNLCLVDAGSIRSRVTSRVTLESGVSKSIQLKRALSAFYNGLGSDVRPEDMQLLKKMGDMHIEHANEVLVEGETASETSSMSVDEKDAPPKLSVLRLMLQWMLPPIVHAFRDLRYGLRHFQADFLASLIISLAGIPKAMSYAALANLPVTAGISTLYVPNIVYALLGHSRQGATSPQSVPCLLLGHMVESTLVGSGFQDDLEERMHVTMLYTIGVGVVMTAIGLLRMSFLLNFISKPVMSGFVSASALIAAASTAKSMMKIKLEKSPILYKTIGNIFKGIPHLHPATFIMSLAFIICIVLLGKLRKRAIARVADKTERWARGMQACLKVPVIVPVVIIGAFMGACLCNFAAFTKWVPEHQVLGRGSTSTSLLYMTAGKEFNGTYYKDRVIQTYAATGSGDGMRVALDATKNPAADFGSSDVRPAVADVKAANVSGVFSLVSGFVCPVANVPIIVDSHQIRFVLDLPLLVGIFNGSIRHWTDPRIVALNPNLPWSSVVPDTPIQVVVRGDKSGTTMTFSEALSACVECNWPSTISPGLQVAWGAPRQLPARGNKLVVDAVSKTPWSIGYATVPEVEAKQTSAAVACVALKNLQGVVVSSGTPGASNATKQWPFMQTTYVLVPRLQAVAAPAGTARSDVCMSRLWLLRFLETLYSNKSAAASMKMKLFSRPADLDKILCPSERRRLAGVGSKPAPTCSNIKMVGYIEAALPKFQVPAPKVQLNFGTFCVNCILLATVILLEHVALVKIYADKSNHKVSITGDLVAVGLANIAGGLTGSFIVGIGLSRSALNADAATQFSLLMSAIVSLIIVYAVAPALTMLPDPVLGVVLFMAVIHMVDWRILRQLCKLKHRGWLDLAAVSTAFFGTCIFGVITGIAIAVGFSLVMFILNSTAPQIVELTRAPGTMVYKVRSNIVGNMVYKVKTNKERFWRIFGFGADIQPVTSQERVRILRIEAPLWFANIALFSEVLLQQLKSAKLKALVLDMSTVPWMDATAATELNKLLDRFEGEDRALLLANTTHDIRQTIRSIRGNFCNGLFFESIYEAQASAKESKVTRRTSMPPTEGMLTKLISGMRILTPAAADQASEDKPVDKLSTPRVAWA